MTSITHTETCDPQAPHNYPRRVLLAVSGLSPQILTETLYALTQTHSPAWVPTEVHLLTTTEGADKARLSLLSDNLGWFRRLRADYELPEIAFDASHIHVLTDAQGQPLDDIRTVADNSAAADSITAKVRELSADVQCALHVSIAGGRKSMGFYVGYALSLYGRAQDRMSHVLVSEPYESTVDFFYPTRHSHVLDIRGRYADTKDAQVTLAQIPFVSLRHGLPEALLQGSASFNETVDAARLALAPASLEINLRRCTIHAAGKEIKLGATSIALLALFARRTLKGLPPVLAPVKDAYNREWAECYLPDYKIACGGEWASYKKTRDSFYGEPEKPKAEPGMQGIWFSITLTRLHKALKDALGPAASAYCVSDGGKRPRCYSLTLPASAIRFID